jgi:hypothetical protein
MFGAAEEDLLAHPIRLEVSARCRSTRGRLGRGGAGWSLELRQEALGCSSRIAVGILGLWLSSERQLRVVPGRACGGHNQPCPRGGPLRITRGGPGAIAGRGAVMRCENANLCEVCLLG